jgi:hypothetical protein
MNPEPSRPYGDTPTAALVQRLVVETRALVRAEVELAKSEAKADLKRELRLLAGFAIAALCALLVLNLLLLAVVFGLARTVPDWASALIIAAVVSLFGAGAALLGWRARVTVPLERTQKTLKEDLRWAKQRVA